MVENRPPIERPLKPRTLVLMAGHIGDAVHKMVAGEIRWVRQHDYLAGDASMLAARAIIEFLVGRSSARRERDIWPEDYRAAWRVEDAEATLLREWLGVIDGRLAHLSLRRADEPSDPPERWHDTVVRLLQLMRRFADEIAEQPGHDQLVIPLNNAEALLA